MFNQLKYKNMWSEQMRHAFNGIMNGIYDRYHKEHPDARFGFYYEVYIDFEEDFEEIYEKVKGMPYEAQVAYSYDYCKRRAAFYDSPHYYEMLDKMVANIKEEDWIPVG